jgi:hypothetical protein
VGALSIDCDGDDKVMTVKVGMITVVTIAMTDYKVMMIAMTDYKVMIT